jgi:hypothetical protein
MACRGSGGRCMSGGTAQSNNRRVACRCGSYRGVTCRRCTDWRMARRCSCDRCKSGGMLSKTGAWLVGEVVMGESEVGLVVTGA